MTFDTAANSASAFKIMDGEPYTPVGGWFTVEDSLLYYLEALFFLIFGSTLFVLRCVAVVLSLVNAVLVFFVTKAIFRNGNTEDDSNIVLIALSGMGLYLFSSVDTVLSYSTYEKIVTTPTVLASFLALNWAFKKRSYFPFCLAGLLFGLQLISSRYCITTFPAFVIVILYYVISNSFGRLKSVSSARVFDSGGSGWYVKIGIFSLGVLFVLLPKLLCLLYKHNTFISYFHLILMVAQVDIFAKEQSIIATLWEFISKYSPTFLVSKLSSTFKLMFVDGYHGKFLLGTTAIVDKFVMPLFFLGIIYSLARIKSKRYLFLVCYLLFNTIFLCIVTYSINDYRFMMFMPFVYIFFSVGFNLISKLLKYRKMFYIIAGIYLLVIVLFNVKNYYTGMGVRPLASYYQIPTTLLGRFLQNNFLDKRVYVVLANNELVTKFSTYNYRERDIERPTTGMGWRSHQKKCDDFTYKKILSNISQIIADNLRSGKDLLFIFDDADCNEEMASHLESILNEKRSSFNIYSKSCKQNFLYLTVEIKKEELSSIDIADVVPRYTGKKYEAVRDLPPEGMVNGLTGKYYSDVELEKLLYTRVDKAINFNWECGSPLPSMKPDYFSVEWNGYIRIDVDGVYWLFTESNDGARLWVDDDLIIENWDPYESYEQCEPVFLESGFHKIKLQYFESEWFASVNLSWASERLAKSIVPHDHLLCVPANE